MRSGHSERRAARVPPDSNISPNSHVFAVKVCLYSFFITKPAFLQHAIVRRLSTFFDHAVAGPSIYSGEEGGGIQHAVNDIFLTLENGVKKQLKLLPGQAEVFPGSGSSCERLLETLLEAVKLAAQDRRQVLAELRIVFAHAAALVEPALRVD